MANSISAGSPVPGSRRADPEFQAWALQHQHERRLHQAQLAQITAHHDPNPEGDAQHQLQAWAQRHAKQKQLHDNALAQLRPH
ncbi:MAG: hypothetical protein VKM98_02770 [Cyanobacteriota bacterium]|nr:hypothetical protein [Cyanobacteriota bacterium]